MTEIMVGGAILAGVGLAGARMFKDQRQAQTKVDDEQALIAFHQRLTKILQNENTCNATFKAAWNYNPTQMATFDVDVISDCTTCTNLAADYDAFTANAVATPYSENAWIDGNARTWRITDISLKSVTSDGTGPAVMKITYGTNPAWAGSRSTKATSVSKDINLMLRFSQHTTPSSRLFKECVAGKQSAINNLQNDICGTMGSQVTSIGSVMVWDDATQGCVAQGTDLNPLKECETPNMVIDGVDSNGRVRCRPLTFGVDPAVDLMQSTGCLPDATIRMEFDPATRKLKAQCE